MKARKETATVTRKQLREALVKMLGGAPQVTVRDFSKVLPRRHWAIAWDDWTAAAEEEGLQVEKIRPIGMIIRRPVAIGMIVQRPGATTQTARPPAEQSVSQQPAPVAEAHSLRNITSDAGAYIHAQRKAGREVSADEAVREVMRQRKVKR